MGFLRFTVITLCGFFALLNPSVSFAADRSGVEEHAFSPPSSLSSLEAIEQDVPETPLFPEVSLLVQDRSRFEAEIAQERLVIRLGGYFDTVAVKGIEVKLIFQGKTDTLIAESDHLGMVRFDRLKKGLWSVEVNDEQHEIATVFLREGGGAETRIDLFLQKKISLFWVILTVVGGLGIFLLGMESMSNGLQTVAGASLRKLVAALTSNRFFALLIGASVTSVVQSSSITTVMVVGFVNSGILHLREALGVIMGANVGTTVTAWILVLAVDKWGLPLLGVAVFVHLFSKREKVKYAALALMGIGMVFFGLDLMKSGFGVMSESPQFLRAFSLFHADSFGEIIKAALLGCVLTMIVQSSSATMGIAIALTSQGVIGFNTAVALVLGSNVGTTITAQLAALGASIDSRRCALFHTLFNLTGAVLAVLFFPFFMKSVFLLMGSVWGVETVWADGRETISAAASPVGIAVVGTLFNVAMAILYFPFLNQMATLLERVIPDKSKKAPFEGSGPSTLLEGRRYEAPMTALTISRYEVTKMGVRSLEMADALQHYLNGQDKESNRDDIFRAEAELDMTVKEISAMVTDLLGEPLAESEIREVKTQLRVSDEYESVSDYLAQILKLYLRIESAGVIFTQSQIDELQKLHNMVRDFIQDISQLEEWEDAIAYLPTMESKGRSITVFVRQLRDAHWARLSGEKLNPLVSTVYGDILSAYRKAKNHLMNVVQSRARVK